MSVDNPLEWSYPSNYNGISCYADSALWALLYKKDNDFYRLVNGFSENNIKAKYNSEDNLPSECKEENYKPLKENIINFYNGITSNPKEDLQSYVINILNILDICFPQQILPWSTDQNDSNDFLNTLIGRFTLKGVNENININEKYEYVFQDNTKEDSNVIRSNTSIINIQINPNSIDFKNIQKKEKELVIYYSKETVENTIEQYNKITKTMQRIETYNSNTGINSFIVNFTRMKSINGGLNSIKTYDPVNFPFKIGDLMLNSIIVHQGTQVDGGHYICYFKHGNQWFLMNDIGGISQVEEEIYNVLGILTNCTTLVYYKASDSEIRETEDKYAHDLFLDGGGGNIQEILPSELSPKSNRGVVKPPNKSKQIIPTNTNWLKQFDECTKQSKSIKGGTRKNKYGKKKYNKCRKSRKSRKGRKTKKNTRDKKGKNYKL